ncbi:uncharacterized protein PADG_08326 [Paracoccidioides brasiliensis Pb18]|uniref:SAP domain-containing protein n=1 Tax=Paracoccidioides brasiliensis (strain Pb18) TaxID=502780 RepID=C1GLT5_PARBD|nr:uncharacterized protein PADG_08326 [Paracoccidioides brasiliensis Pb18]EEH43401.2 hypothetical protein PADG_08326 [Paracoccidioides brasiliensis Pb18]
MASPTSPAIWLPSLKVRQLQRLASLTGILSSGAKSILIERLYQNLHVSIQQPVHNVNQEECSIDDKKTASILSIDMGIRNFGLRPFSRSRGTRWPYQLSLPLCQNSDRALNFNLDDEMRPKKKITKDRKSLPLNGPDASSGCDSTHVPGNGDGNKVKQKESFAPKVYAAHAYTLMSSLLATYKPTHVLIERQRFRSGGGSAVPEWTIRVGVFEGMLYAVLRAMQQERKGEIANIVVQGVEPQRVLRYWIDHEEGLDLPPKGKLMGSSPTPNVSKKLSSSKCKQIKIDRIGELLSSCIGIDVDSTSSTGTGDHLGINLGDDGQIHEVVKAYLKKWKKLKGGKLSTKRTSGATTDNSQTLEIEKLDDLADCLLQGITWLEWQNTLQNVARHGFDVVSSKMGD